MTEALVRHQLNDYPKRRIARFAVSGELMHELLLLPEGVTVSRLEYNVERNEYEVLVEGDGLPEVAVGELIPRVTPRYEWTRADNVTRFIGW